MHLAEPEWLLALWAAPAVVVLLVFALAAGSRALSRFMDPALHGRLIRGAPRRGGMARPALVGMAIAAVALALARPQGRLLDEEAMVRGRDIVFVVDVSRSMLARDLAPNRLARAKVWIEDLVGSLGGDRVALVAFAGHAVVKCPLTTDYEFFRLALEDLSPASVSRGGTLIGDALRTTLRDVLSDDQGGAYRDVILFTDGEDHESLPVAAAETIGAKGARIIAIGLGDPTAGTPVPEGGGQFIEHDGQVVRSRLDPKNLTEIAHASPGGAFLLAGTGTLDLAQVYADLSSTAGARALASSATVRRVEYFPVFIAGALALLVLDAFMGAKHVR